MTFITTGASFDCAKTLGATLPRHRRRHAPQQPYAFLSHRDLREMVATMVD